MGRVQLGRRFSDAENASIVAFLKTLTGDQPSFSAADPAALFRQDAAADSVPVMSDSRRTCGSQVFHILKDCLLSRHGRWSLHRPGAHQTPRWTRLEVESLRRSLA